MTFSNDKPIYIQMADRLCDEILSGVYQDDDRIPSVREYAVLLEVNTNTAVKAYEQLAREEIIYNKRGLGYKEADPQGTQEGVYERTSAGTVPPDATARHFNRRCCENMGGTVATRHNSVHNIPEFSELLQLSIPLHRQTNVRQQTKTIRTII